MYDEDFRKVMNEIYRFNFGLSLFHKVTGLSPARCFELPLAISVLELAENSESKAVLDVGCGDSCFPLWMVTRGITVHCLDVDESALVQKRYAQKVGVIKHPIEERFGMLDRPKGKMNETSYSSDNGRFTVKVCDARNMDYPDQSFDAVSCISAIEHIPDDGDIMAIKEIGRVLRPGGRAFISVPYAQEFRKGMSHGGHFEMKYDCKALRERLVEPSGLLLEREDFIFDRSSRRVGGLIYYDLPGYARYLLGWTGIPLLVSQVLSYRDKATKSNAQFAWVSLRKIEG